MHFVYILKCFYDNGKNIYYRGYTNDINRRFSEHKRGYEKYTRRFHGNMVLIYLEEIIHKDKKEERRKAIKREKELKNWSRSKVDNILKTKRKRIEDLMRKHFTTYLV